MLNSSGKTSIWLPVMALIVAIASIQVGAALAKSLFPLIGASGVTSLRLGLACLILLMIFRPWRLHFLPRQRLALLLYGLTLGGMNYLFYLSLRTVPLGVAVALEFTGPLALALFTSRRPVDFLWVVLVILGLCCLLPLRSNMAYIDPVGAACALGAGACWALYIIFGSRAGAQHGPATVAPGTLIAALFFASPGIVEMGSALWHWSILLPGLGVAILSTVLPYSLEMIALTRLPARTLGTLLSLEPAIGAMSGLIFLGETLTLTQTLAIVCIIIASAGSTLTVRRKPRIRHTDDKR